jgi:two-component system nitrate/nitrite sensor histidine kinase NarQ
MEQGNWLAPIIVLIVTSLLATPLFKRLENTQKELSAVSKSKVQLEEREKIAQELHDGIAQSMFLLSVKLDKLERETGINSTSQELRKTVHQMNDYVRDSIVNLRAPVIASSEHLHVSLQLLSDAFRHETGLSIQLNWTLKENWLTPKEQAVALAVVREGLFNIRKHSNGLNINVSSIGNAQKWTILIEDDGQLFNTNTMMNNEQFGIKMLSERCEELGWKIDLTHKKGSTKLLVSKG